MNHELKYPREYSDEIRKFEVTDRGHADIFNAPVNDLINNDAYMKEHMDVVENTLAGHTENGDIHVTAAQKSAWTNKAEKTVATTASAGLMGAADKSKLDGITAGAEVNQNAISTLVAGSTNVTANSKTAAVTLTSGSNITITGDNATKKVTISAPTAIKNPQPIAIQLNGTTAASYDGSAAKTVNITPAGIGAPGTATFKALEDKVTQLNSDLTTHKSSADHDWLYYTKSKIDNLLDAKANNSHTHNYLPLNGGTISANLEVKGAMSADYIYSATPDKTMVIQDGGYINLQTGLSVQVRNFNDDGWAAISASNFVTQSSKKYKKNIKDMPNEIAMKLLKLKPVTYDYNNEIDGSNCFGLIAEDVTEIEQYPVMYDKDGNPDGIDYSKFVPQLIKMVQILQSEIADLKDAIDI